MHMLGDEAQQQQFVQKCRQVIVQKECSLHEEIWHEMHQIANDQDFSGAAEMSVGRLVQVVAEATATQQVKCEQYQVEE